MSSNETCPRVILIGDSGVGKTSLIIRGTTDKCSGITTPTVGAGVSPMTIRVGDQSHTFHLWDTAGQEIYRSIVPLYFKLAACALVVFAFDDSNSFANLNSWIDMLESNTEHDVPVVIVGNKADVDQRMVEIADAKDWAAERQYPIFITSALTGENVRSLFEFVAENYVANCRIATTQLLQSNKKRKCCR